MNQLFLHILLVFSLLCLRCTGPQTVNEYRAWVRSSSMVTKKEYVVKGLDLSGAETRLRAFMNKCFKGKGVAETTKVSSGGVGVGGWKSTSTWRPYINRTPKRVTLIVQNNQTDSVGMPKGGWFEFIVEVTPAPGGGVQVFSGTYRIIPPGASDDAEAWLRDKGQFCYEP